MRWWDHWLKDIDNGVADEPAVQVYEQHLEPPQTDRTILAGAWRAADTLPDHQAPPCFLAEDKISTAAPTSVGCASVPYLPAASRNGGLWDAGVPFTLPGEQSEDSARALNFTGPPLEADLPIFGNPTFALYISSEVQVIPVAVRLLEVAPDNTSVLVTKGILNTTRRQGMDAPQALTPGKITPIAFHLEATAWRFKRGNRIRLSVNGSDFPNVWPTPQKGTLTLHWGPEHHSQLTLPVWNGGRDLPFTFSPSPSPTRPTGSGSAPWRVVHDVLEDRYRLQIERGNGEMGVHQRQPATPGPTPAKATRSSGPASTPSAAPPAP